MNYQYLCDDRSLLYPVLKKYLWAPALQLVAPHRSANSMTLLGNLCSMVGFAFLALAPLTEAPSESFWLPAAAIFLYLSLDNMDGAQARRTGSSSPLGEFLDHWCDAFNLGFLVLGYCFAMGIAPWMTLLVAGLGAMAYLATMWEQRMTGWLQFGPLGSVEGIFLTCLMYVIVATVGLDTFAHTPILGSLTFAHVYYIIVCAGFAQTAISSIMRVYGWIPSRAAESGRTWKPRAVEFVPAIVFIALGALSYSFGRVDFSAAGFVVVLSGCLVGGRQIIARVRELPYHGLDALTLAGHLFLFLLVMSGASAGLQNGVAWSLVGYLLLRLAADFHLTTSALSAYLRPREMLSIYYARRR